MKDIGELCKKYENYIINLRREFHQNPELSLQEEHTSARICEELERMKISYERVGNYNVVAVLGNGENGKRLGIRADMDALPVTEKTGLPFASQKTGIMHACGHDSHTAMLLGAASVLNEQKENIKGRIYFCFQSAEEMNEGASEITQYLKQKGGVDQMIGLHIWADLEQGKIALLQDKCMAGCIGWTVDLTGLGGHGSRPDLVRDPIKAACDLVLKFSSIPGNFYDVMDPCVVSTGLVKAGTMSNIFPSEASIEGSCRYFNMEGAETLISKMQMMVDGTAMTYGLKGKLNILGYMYPVLNTPSLIETARALIPDIEGLELDTDFGPLLSSENFSEYLKEFPGFFAILGGGNREKGITYGMHHDKFDLDESAMRKGCEFFVRYACNFVC